MAYINVRRDVTDSFYRYKMERIQTKIEGKGNGIKTVIPNLSTIAQQLAREGNIVIKYFGFELGAQTNQNPSDDRWIINGAHDAAKLQDSLDGFINKFVLCKKCKNPETEFVFKDGRILLDCKACGQRSDVDPRLKLSSFILKNQEKKGKSSKAERKAARRAKQNGNKDNGSGSDDKHSENGNHEDENGLDVVSDEATNGIDRVDSPVAAKNDEPDDNEHEWAVDMDPAAVKRRQESLPEEFKQKLTMDDDEDGEGSGNTVYDQLGDWIQASGQEKGSIDKVDDLQVYLKAKELGIEGKHRTVLVLVQTLFDHTIGTQVPKRASMLKQIIGDSEKHQKALLGGTERLIAQVGMNHPEVYNQIVRVLQLYYHHDLLSEEVAIKWGSKASKKYVDLSTSRKIRKAAEPFIRWLEEAEESSDEESD